MVTSGFWCKPVLPEFNMIMVSMRHAMVGVSAPQSQRGVTTVWRALGKIPRLSPADGWRGCQERKVLSGKFVSFIIQSFQFGLDFLQAISITASGRVG